MILDEHLFCFCFKYSIGFCLLDVVLACYLMCVKSPLKERVAHSAILSTELEEQHMKGRSWGTAGPAKALEPVSASWPLSRVPSACSVHKTT